MSLSSSTIGLMIFIRQPKSVIIKRNKRYDSYMPEIRIENPQEWLSNHDRVHIENVGEREILTANRHGELQVGDETRPLTVNVSDEDVTVL